MPDLDTTRVGSISTYSAEDSPDHHANDHNEVHGRLQGGFAGVTFTIGAEGGNSINVGLQLEDVAGVATDYVSVFTAYLSDDADGIGVTATAPDGDIAVGTDGIILAEIVADKVFILESEADGDVDLDIGEASTGTWYLVVLTPGGGKIVSGAITFV